MNGYSVISDSFRYQGNKKHGTGKYTHSSGGHYEGTYNPKLSAGTNMNITGEWEDNLKHGRGAYKYPNGDVYDGDWVAGLRSGRGTYTYSATSIKV